MSEKLRLLSEALKHEAHSLGFVLTGIAAAAEPKRIESFHHWLANGYAGQMQYLEKRKEAYSHPSYVLDGCRTILMLALPYSATSPNAGPHQGRVARYAAHDDYHDVIHEKLRALKEWIVNQEPGAFVRGIVDTAPLLEREFAEAAGLGWIGKNTLLLNREWGSYFFLAALLTDIELPVDAPLQKGHCGTCTACLDACPTQAFPEPHVLDASKCISYLTIEHRENIPDRLAERLSGWAFGCDICQEVCPWNRKIPEHSLTPEIAPQTNYHLDILTTLEISDDEFRQHYRKTPLWRSKRRGIVRNALLVAGEQRLETAVPRILQLLTDEEPLLRAAASWSLSRIKPSGWRQHVKASLELEEDGETKLAMQSALAHTPEPHSEQ